MHQTVNEMLKNQAYNRITKCISSNYWWMRPRTASERLTGNKNEKIKQLSLF